MFDTFFMQLETTQKYVQLCRRVSNLIRHLLHKNRLQWWFLSRVYNKYENVSDPKQIFKKETLRKLI